MIHHKLKDYATFIFDCDGVILDSNKVKTEAFYQVAFPFGIGAAERLVQFHTSHGGVSRYQKFDHFVSDILGIDDGGELSARLVLEYAKECQKSLIKCPVNDDLVTMRNITDSATWIVVSGSDQQELREILTNKKISGMFDGGIFGSPDDKQFILSREIKSGLIKPPALFIGDSKYDYIASSAFGIEFLFLSQWTEFIGWKRYRNEHGFASVSKLNLILNEK